MPKQVAKSNWNKQVAKFKLNKQATWKGKPICQKYKAVKLSKRDANQAAKRYQKISRCQQVQKAVNKVHKICRKSGKEDKRYAEQN